MSTDIFQRFLFSSSWQILAKTRLQICHKNYCISTYHLICIPVLQHPEPESPRCGQSAKAHGWEYHWKIKSLGDSKIKCWGFRARFQLYWNQILQENTRWKALAEIYTMHAFAPFSDLEIFVKFCIFQNVCQFFANVAVFSPNRLFFAANFTVNCRNFEKS